MLETYDQDVIGEGYRSLIELAFKKCDKFALVIQKDLFINDEWAVTITEGLPVDLMFYSGDKVWLAVNSHEGYFLFNKELDSDGDIESLLKRLFS